MSDCAEVPSLTSAKLHHIESLIERGWNQGVNSVDDAGAPCWWTDPRAISWCLVGAATKARADDAIVKIAGQLDADFITQVAQRTIAWNELSPFERSRILLIEFNDVPGRTKEEITDLLHKTRMTCEAFNMIGSVPHGSPVL